MYTRYPIVARRAWPTGCIAFRPSASREQRYLAYKVFDYYAIFLKYKMPYRRARVWPVGASKGYLAYKLFECKIPLLSSALGQARATILYFIYTYALSTTFIFRKAAI